jgi:hypothetical protein
MFSDDLVSISGNTKVRAEKGVYRFNKINIIAIPNY